LLDYTRITSKFDSHACPLIRKTVKQHQPVSNDSIYNGNRARLWLVNQWPQKLSMMLAYK